MQFVKQAPLQTPRLAASLARLCESPSLFPPDPTREVRRTTSPHLAPALGRGPTVRRDTVGREHSSLGFIHFTALRPAAQWRRTSTRMPLTATCG